MFRIICNGEDAAHEESIRRNFLSRLVSVQLCAQWRPLLLLLLLQDLCVALETLQVGVLVLKVLLVLSLMDEVLRVRRV